MTQRPSRSVSLIASLAAAAALALPGMAMADAYWHPANNEAGVTTHPQHFQSDRTRAQVQAEAQAAVGQGGNARFNAGAYPAPAPQTGPGKTRQQVSDELLSETPAQRQARERAMGG